MYCLAQYPTIKVHAKMLIIKTYFTNSSKTIMP